MESKRFIREDLKIFRGTAKECDERQKEGLVKNLEIYLAWDSGEIFIGNKQGALVRYGGGSGNIEREVSKAFDTFKGELESFISEKAESTIQTSIKDTLANIRSEFTQSINTATTNLTNSINAKVATISAAADSINGLNDQIMAITNRFAAYYTKNDVYTKSEVQAVVSGSAEDLDAKITTTRNNLGDLADRVTTLSGNIDTVETDIASVKQNYATKEYVDDSHPILYLSGSQMQNLGINSYRLVFCTQNGNDFVAGTLYYFDPNQNQFRMVSGGSSSGSGETQTKINCSTALGLEYSINGQSLSSNSLYELSSEALPIVITGSYTNAESGGAVNGTAKISRYFNDVLESDIISIPVNNTQSNGSATTSVQQFSRSTIGTYSIRISASAKVETANITYSIENNNLEKKISIYQPILFGYDDNFSHYRNYVGKFTLSANHHYYIYIPTSESINDITLSGFSYDYGEPEIVEMEVNGISGVSYKRYDLHTPNSTIQIAIN